MTKDVDAVGPDVILRSFSPGILNGLNLNPFVVGFEERSVLGVVSGDDRVSVTFELPPKPFFDEPAFSLQQVVISVHPLLRKENVVFQPPFLPLLNEYYGRKIHTYNTVRSEPEGIGIITDLTKPSLAIGALNVRTLVNRIFRAFGISANPSPAGLVGLRLIEQMGGLQDCRVFKVTGVRNLMKAYRPDKSFNRAGALQIIGRSERDSGKTGFSHYKSLGIGAGPGQELGPKEALDYLLRKGVFRPGLDLVCDHCELQNWVHLDDARIIRFVVTKRTKEIGIQRALGATTFQVLAGVLGSGANLLLLGIGIGLIGSGVLTRFIRVLLYGVEAQDLATYALTCTAIFGFGMSAAYVPARRAVRGDPVAALRQG